MGIQIVKNKVLHWLRWIFVLPGTLIAASIIYSSLDIIMCGFARFGVNNSDPEVMHICKHNNFVLYLASYFSLVFVSYLIAPKNKFKTAIVFFALNVFIILAISVTAFFKGLDGNYLSLLKIISSILIGSLVGLYIARIIDKGKKV